MVLWLAPTLVLRARERVPDAESVGSNVQSIIVLDRDFLLDAVDFVAREECDVSHRRQAAVPKATPTR